MPDEDKRMLEMAAKAAGGLVYVPEIASWIHEDANGNRGSWWRPLDDDGDALRLAVALRLSIDHNHSADQQRWVAADRQGCEGCYAPVSCVEDEFEGEDGRLAATRRAIVRAAAAIGEKML